MILTEKHIIKKTDKRYKELDNICFLSKNVYNSALYRIRKYYFENSKYLSFAKVSAECVKDRQSDYTALPAKVSQQTLRLVDQNFRSFFALLKCKDKSLRPKPPKYLDKTGRCVTIYTSQAISRPGLDKGTIKLSGVVSNVVTKKATRDNIRCVRLVPKGNHIVVEVCYEVTDTPLLDNNDRYASIDIGVNNLATIGSNVIAPLIVNGRPLKSINQFYNKLKAKHKDKPTTSLKRSNKVNDYLHKASRYIINHLVSNDISTLVIGKNIGWKQEVNMSKKNNQSFVQIPHARFIHMLEYKAKLVGITTELTEESYTSKCSFLDDEVIGRHKTYKGKRIKRGLFRTQSGKLVNADWNGAMNILRKVVGDFYYDPIEVCSTPTVYTVKLNSL